MNETLFIRLLDSLEETDWQALAEGGSLLMIDDQRLTLGPADAPNAIVRAPEGRGGVVAALKRSTVAAAVDYLNTYYLTHPLTLAGFNQQVEGLIERHGAGAFAAVEGNLPQYTLFVEGGEVVAESQSSPRHRYGAFCELEQPLTGDALAARVRRWLTDGEAHERYLSMNVCRYSC